MDPEVTFHSIGILSDDFGEINTPLPVNKLQNGHPLFTLKEGSEYRLKLTFTILHNIVSGLTYTNAVWKGGMQGQMDPEVTFHSIGILSDDFGEINTPLHVDKLQNGHPLFTLKEGSEYRLKLTFMVLHNIVSDLTYTNAVWKGGMQVDRSKGMLGTFASQREPYVRTLEEEKTPSGVLARGIYTAKLKEDLKTITKGVIWSSIIPPK